MGQQIAHCDMEVKSKLHRHFRQDTAAPCDYKVAEGQEEKPMKLRLKEVRRDRHLTQAQVAKRAGISTSYYTELELGKKTMNVRRMEQIARALGVRPADLLEAGPSATEFVDLYQSLPQHSREAVLSLMRSMRERG